MEDVRQQQNMYAQVNIGEFVLTVVDLPECVLRISISMVAVGTRCTLRRQTDLKRSRMPLITVPVRNVRRFDLDTLGQIIGHIE